MAFVNVQASAAMYSVIEPAGWAAVFGVFVAKQDGTPVAGLTLDNFSVWSIVRVEDAGVQLLTDLYSEFPTSGMPGIYRLQTKNVLGPDNLAPHELVYAIRVSYRQRSTQYTGLTTAAVTYLGKPR